MICQDDQRREQVRAHRGPNGRRDLNGLDYVEVDDDQTTLTAYFIGKLPPQLTRGQTGADSIPARRRRPARA